jgi:hypothetical protein
MKNFNFNAKPWKNLKQQELKLKKLEKQNKAQRNNRRKKGTDFNTS